MKTKSIITTAAVLAVLVAFLVVVGDRLADIGDAKQRSDAAFADAHIEVGRALGEAESSMERRYGIRIDQWQPSIEDSTWTIDGTERQCRLAGDDTPMVDVEVLCEGEPLPEVHAR